MQGFMYFTFPPCILVQLLSILAEVTLQNLLCGYTRTKMLPELHHKHIIPMPMHSDHQLAPQMPWMQLHPWFLDYQFKVKIVRFSAE